MKINAIMRVCVAATAACILLDQPAVAYAQNLQGAFSVDEGSEGGKSEAGIIPQIEDILHNETVSSTEAAIKSTAETAADDETESKESVQDALMQPVGAAALLVSDMTDEEYIQAAEDAVGACWGYTNLGISDVSDNLNVRSIPQEDGRLVGKLPKNAACEIIGEEDGWTHIQSGEVEGYVKSDYLLTGYQAKKRVNEFLTTVAKVTTDALKVREEPSLEAEVITLVAQGEELEVIEEQGDWVKVFLDDQEVYVSADYVDVGKELDTAITMTEVLYGAGVSNVRAELCQYALQFVGNRYVWGGTSLTKGADCSGFVLSVFKKFGVSLPHYSGSQAKQGTTIKVAEAKPGDLIFYGNGKRINHVAICIGNGRVVHASSPKTGIKTSGIYYRTPVKAVRILRD